MPRLWVGHGGGAQPRPKPNRQARAGQARAHGDPHSAQLLVDLAQGQLSQEQPDMMAAYMAAQSNIFTQAAAAAMEADAALAAEVSAAFEADAAAEDAYTHW